MKTLSQISIFIISLFLIFSCGTPGQKTERVVIIALDGISVEGFHAAKHPNLDKLINEGVLSLSTRNVMPSGTQQYYKYRNHNCLSFWLRNSACVDWGGPDDNI